MTVHELYRKTIRPLAADERLQLARLIINDLSPDSEAPGVPVPDRPCEVRDLAHLEELLLAGLNSGPGIKVTPEYWDQKRAALIERHERKARSA